MRYSYLELKSYELPELTVNTATLVSTQLLGASKKTLTF